MTIRIEPAKMEGYDEHDHIFTVECFDECTAEVAIKQSVHTVESWQEMAEAITEALKRLELK